MADASASPSPSEAEILQAVSQRESHRLRQSFAESDEIRQQLRDLGVELYDKTREWRCKDGRRGVLFTAGPFECAWTDEEILAKVQEREESRRSKEWDRSNVLRDELRVAGVELNDRESVWRTLAGRQSAYAGQPRGATLSGVEIHRHVVDRERRREVKDFAGADEIRASLAQHGVEIFDSERLWKAMDGRQGAIITGTLEVVCTLSDQAISGQVELREQARNAKRWEAADQIRDDLRRAGVEVMDSQRIWVTTEGRQGPYPGAPPRAHQQAQQQVAFGGGQGLMTNAGPPGNADHAAAAQAIAMLAKTGQVPTGLAVQLLGQLGGAAMAMAAAGPAGGGAFNALPGAPRFSDATVVALISAREAARERHDWQAADAIRGDLRNHGVEVWDKEKMWKADDGRHGQMGVQVQHPNAMGGAALGSALGALGALGLGQPRLGGGF